MGRVKDHYHDEICAADIEEGPDPPESEASELQSIVSATIAAIAAVEMSLHAAKTALLTPDGPDVLAKLDVALTQLDQVSFNAGKLAGCAMRKIK